MKRAAAGISACRTDTQSGLGMSRFAPRTRFEVFRLISAAVDGYNTLSPAVRCPAETPPGSF